MDTFKASTLTFKATNAPPRIDIVETKVGIINKSGPIADATPPKIKIIFLVDGFRSTKLCASSTT